MCNIRLGSEVCEVSRVNICNGIGKKTDEQEREEREKKGGKKRGLKTPTPK